MPIFSEGTGKIAGAFLEYRQMAQFEASIRSHQISRKKFRRLSSMTKKRSTSKTDDDNDLIDRHDFIPSDVITNMNIDFFTDLTTYQCITKWRSWCHYRDRVLIKRYD